MGNNWIDCELGDVIELKRGYDLPKTTRVAGTIPVVSSSGESGFHNESKVKAPGVVTGRYGTIGEVFYIDIDFWPLNTTLYVRDFKGNDPLFIYYFLKTISYSDYTDKAAVPGINRNHIHKAKVKIPESITYQQEIAKNLRALDNKITLNRQINRTLEQMAQALFKSWFVDFDPVIDNALDAGFFEQDLAFPDELLRRAEARRTVREHCDFKPLPDATRQLFPAAFEECAEPSFGLGGWVPQGWAVKCVSEAITINPKVNLAKNKVAKFVDMKALPTQGYSIEDVIEKPFTGGMKFQSDDILLARITPCLQNGKTGIVDFLSENESGFGSTEFIILRGNENIHHTYIACLARYENFRQHVMQSMVGSSGRQRVQNGCFDDYQIAIPSIEIMSKFASLVLPSFKKFRQNTNESIALANLRDTLLPKLISGELLLEGMDADLAQEGAA
ncbi:restriction endonuclease subunit S [Aeromonas veronii]|uniref:restriction endonuclease subunit S n=1 Tax=Aeromonas veronii TaxID=654 RepID=UPI002B4A7551|nr:restriction endonuclease subunit S [Aeromonas veronii]